MIANPQSIGKSFVSLSFSYFDLDLLVEVARECRKRANLTEDAPIKLYEEIQTGYVDRISNLEVTLDQGLEELMDGDIIVYHKQCDEAQCGKKLKSLSDFYTYMQYKYEITFMDKCNVNEPFSIEMSLKSSYMEMATKVAQRLGCKPLYIQFFKCQPYK